jgi:hypothetical protein
MLNILIIVVIVGVPALLICKMLLRARRGVTQCPCDGNVTPLAGHGPCGCTLQVMTEEDMARHHKQHK